MDVNKLLLEADSQLDWVLNTDLNAGTPQTEIRDAVEISKAASLLVIAHCLREMSEPKPPCGVDREHMIGKGYDCLLPSGHSGRHQDKDGDTWT